MVLARSQKPAVASMGPRGQQKRKQSSVVAVDVDTEEVAVPLAATEQRQRTAGAGQPMQCVLCGRSPDTEPWSVGEAGAAAGTHCKACEQTYDKGHYSLDGVSGRGLADVPRGRGLPIDVLAGPKYPQGLGRSYMVPAWCAR